MGFSQTYCGSISHGTVELIAGRNAQVLVQTWESSARN